MSVDAWILLWKVCLALAVATFAAMSIWVSIGGFFDVLRLLTRLRNEPDSDDE